MRGAKSDAETSVSRAVCQLLGVAGDGGPGAHVHDVMYAPVAVSPEELDALKAEVAEQQARARDIAAQLVEEELENGQSKHYADCVKTRDGLHNAIKALATLDPRSVKIMNSLLAKAETLRDKDPTSYRYLILGTGGCRHMRTREPYSTIAELAVRAR